jgi:DNA-binding transcriptional ArsR family regulator
LLYISQGMGSADESRTTDLLLALSHPLRRRILRMLADEQPRSPSDLAESLDLPLSAVSYHVRVLANRGAVRLVRTAPVRGSKQHFYLPSIEADWARSVLEGPESPNGQRKSKRGRWRKRATA